MLGCRPARQQLVAELIDAVKTLLPIGCREPVSVTPSELMEDALFRGFLRAISKLCGDCRMTVKFSVSKSSSVAIAKNLVKSSQAQMVNSRSGEYRSAHFF